MTPLEEAGERIGATRAARVRRRLAAVLAGELPGDVAIEERPDGLALSARGLRRRMAEDARLRALPAMAKEAGRG